MGWIEAGQLHGRVHSSELPKAAMPDSTGSTGNKIRANVKIYFF